MLNLQGLTSLLNDPDFRDKKWPEIETWKSVYYDMSLHVDGVMPRYYNLRDGNINDKIYYEPAGYIKDAEYQRRFDGRLLNKYPTESELVRQWRLGAYKPFTKAPFRQAIQVVTGAIFQDSNYSIEVADKDDNDYIWAANFEGQSLPAYFASSFQDIVNDPNGLFMVIPKQAWYETTTPRIEPTLTFIASKHIVCVRKDEVIFDHDGYRWAVNKVGYFRFRENKDHKWEEVDAGRGYYAHLLGRLPLLVAGGEWNSQGYYESHLDAAKAVADEYISGKSSEQFVMKDASHPIRVEAATDCPECDGIGKLNDTRCSEHGEESCNCPSNMIKPFVKSCGMCGGSGNLQRNPGQVMVVPAEQMTTSGQLVQYVNPDTAINKLHLENNREVYADILQALHIYYKDEAESGAAKDKDMETRYQFILNISNDYFDRLIYESIVMILSLRNVRAANGVTVPAATDFIIVKPTQFAIKTAQDLLDEYKTASEAGTPTFMRSQQLLDYQDKQFGGNDILKHKTQFILQRDPLALLSAAERSSLTIAGGFSQRDLQLSINISTLLDAVIRDTGGERFKGMEYAEIDALLMAKFDELIPPPVIVRDEEL